MLCTVCCSETSQNGSGKTPLFLSETSEMELYRAFSLVRVGIIHHMGYNVQA